SAFLHHPNIVTVFGVVTRKVNDSSGTDEIFSGLIMERMGPSLQRVLDGPREAMPSVAHRISIVQQIASALMFAHNFGIVHSDIKPDNILLALDANIAAASGSASTPIAKLTDF